MVDPVQIVLLLVIIVLTILLVVLGIQVFYILKELRNTIKKTNKVLDNANSITENIEEPLSALSSLLMGVKSGSFFTIAKFINNFLGKQKEEKRETD
ncbi:MAG TPA: hypothetical protein VM077_00825 [Candidatus Limnocylindrales bacterium]|nr:hypothetical protein [Candidatus Limnocylindrales bacterium]